MLLNGSINQMDTGVNGSQGWNSFSVYGKTRGRDALMKTNVQYLFDRSAVQHRRLNTLMHCIYVYIFQAHAVELMYATSNVIYRWWCSALCHAANILNYWDFVGRSVNIGVESTYCVLKQYMKYTPDRLQYLHFMPLAFRVEWHFIPQHLSGSWSYE